MEDLSSTLTEIVDPNVRNQLIQAGDDIGKLGKVIANLGKQSRTEARELAFLEGFAAEIEANRGLLQKFSFDTIDRPQLSSDATSRLARQLSGVFDIQAVSDNDALNRGPLKIINELRSTILGLGDGAKISKESIQKAKDALVDLGGLDPEKVDILFDSAEDFADILPIISEALEIEAQAIESSSYAQVLSRETQAIKSYESALTRAANRLSSEFDRVAEYFTSLSSISSSSFREGIALQQSAGNITATDARSRQLDFDRRQVLPTKQFRLKILKNPIAEIKSEDFEGSADLKAYDMAFDFRKVKILVNLD